MPNTHKMPAIFSVIKHPVHRCSLILMLTYGKTMGKSLHLLTHHFLVFEIWMVMLNWEPLLGVVKGNKK